VGWEFRVCFGFCGVGLGRGLGGGFLIPAAVAPILQGRQARQGKGRAVTNCSKSRRALLVQPHCYRTYFINGI
jgi:hypothetical protein